MLALFAFLPLRTEGRVQGRGDSGVAPRSTWEGEGGAASVGDPALPFQVSDIGPGLHFFLPS